jgi:hypothetical protein
MKNAFLGAAALALVVAGLSSCGDNAECSSYKFDFVDGQDYDVVFYKTATLSDSSSSVWSFTGCEEEASAGFFIFGPATVPFVRDKETMTFLNATYTIDKESRSKVQANDGTNSVVFTKVD